MIDVGCGTGGQVELARSLGIVASGIDGDHLCKRNIQVAIHDYTKGPYEVPYRAYDLAWCVEFVEHVEWMYIPNFLKTFQGCEYVLLSAGLPGQGGHHHVNLHEVEYWIGVMNSFGFDALEQETIGVRKASTMKQKYVRNQAIVYKNMR